MATVYYVVGMRFKKIKIDLNIEQSIVVTNNKEKNWCIGKRPLSKVQMMRCTFLYDLEKIKRFHASCLYKSCISVVQDRFPMMGDLFKMTEETTNACSKMEKNATFLYCGENYCKPQFESAT